MAALTRAWLAASLPPDAAATGRDALAIVGVGTLYDLCFAAYALLPGALFLWLCPEALWRRAGMRRALHVLCFLTLFGFAFIAAAEVLFWNEFGARLNFISVDYLVYRREVTQNILESYPVGLILAGLVVASLASYGLLARRLHAALQAQEPLGRRSALAAALMLPAVLAYLGVDQGLRERFPDAVDRELASDGPYQFVAAFRNNELDYMELYPTMSGERAAGLLRSQLGAPPRGFLDADPRSIVRRVEAGPGPEHRWNVILVMVESLGAEYVGRLTPGSTLTPNLDRLADESEFFTRAYATGTRTVRGLEAVTLSIPPTPGRSIVKRIGRETGMWSLGDVLGSRGYDVRFLYGGRGYFDNMNAFFTGNGYRVVDQSSVPDAELRFTNAWGMSDQDLYRQALKAADAAAAAGTPFFFHLMTTSNHRPYTYPVGSPTSGPGRGGRAPSPTRMPRSRASSTPRARVPGSPTRSS